MSMEAFIAVTSAGLLAYWCQRTWLQLCGPENEVNETLDEDVRFGRRVAIAIRTMFMPPDLLLP